MSKNQKNKFQAIRNRQVYVINNVAYQDVYVVNKRQSSKRQKKQKTKKTGLIAG